MVSARAERVKRVVPRRPKKEKKLKDDGTRVTISVTLNPQKIWKVFESKESTPLLLQIATILDAELKKRGVK
jgi:hypothetical protein